jgi:hypothetical protein
MRRTLACTVVALTFLCDFSNPDLKAQSSGATRHIARKEFVNRVRGGWAGQMIGVSFGAPTEFQYLGKIIEGELPPWRSDYVTRSIDQDDLYVEMTFADVMDRMGLDATTAQYGEAFKNSQYDLWHANAAARRLLKEGIEAPRSGQRGYNPHANDIDFQIESDFIGLMSPGLPRAARDYSLRVGSVMSSGDGLNGGLFITGMYAAAFFEADPRRIVEAGLAMLPPSSGYAAIIRDALDWHAAHPQDWQSAWHLIEDKWNKSHSCPETRPPFNIDARLNGAYVALGLLYGDRDFNKTLEIATRSGQDSDCNPSSALGILGVMLGYDRIPKSWRSGIPDMADRKFAHTNYSFDEIVASTIKRAELVVHLAGGTVTAEGFDIPEQSAEPPSIEQWNLGVPDRIIPASDPAWQWSGDWKTSPISAGVDTPGMVAQAAGATATLTFTGTAVTILGGYSRYGGRAEVWVDGEKGRPTSTWIPERTQDRAHWQAFGLEPGTHVLKIVTTGGADERSADAAVEIASALVYRIR